MLETGSDGNAAQAFATLAHLPVPDRLQAALQQALPAGGASGCLAYLDAATQRLSLARAGAHTPGANAVLGSLVHGLACQAASASFVFPPGTVLALLAGLATQFFLSGQRQLSESGGSRRARPVPAGRRDDGPAHRSARAHHTCAPGFLSARGRLLRICAHCT
jgi:hypothetical protein